MVAAVVQVDVRRAAEFGEHDDQRAVEHAALGQVVHEAGERPIELAELLDVEVEILVVRVVVRVRHLHERDALLEQPPGEQAMPAEIVLAVALDILRRFLGDVEHVALLHELLRLLERIRERLGHGRAAAIEEVLVDVAAEILPGRVGRFGKSLRAAPCSAADCRCPVERWSTSGRDRPSRCRVRRRRRA